MQKKSVLYKYVHKLYKDTTNETDLYNLEKACIKTLTNNAISVSDLYSINEDGYNIINKDKISEYFFNTKCIHDSTYKPQDVIIKISGLTKITKFFQDLQQRFNFLNENKQAGYVKYNNENMSPELAHDLFIFMHRNDKPEKPQLLVPFINLSIELQTIIFSNNRFYSTDKEDLEHSKLLDVGGTAI